MIKTRLAVAGLVSLALALPAYGRTTKSTYSNSCADVWTAVKDTLSNPENYEVKESDDSRMTAAYHVKHTVHVTITGAALQRMNHVTLISKGEGACEMQIVSNYSGFEHNDRDDFKKRVDESLAKTKPVTPPQPVTKSDAPPTR